jgi:hypothetical protein
VGVDADDDVREYGLAHVACPPQMRCPGDPASGQDCDGMDGLSLSLALHAA